VSEYQVSSFFLFLFLVLSASYLEEMTGKAVQCSSCRTFEVRDTLSVPADFTCGKRTHLQLLKNRVRELELELEELRIIREAELVINRSFRDVVTS